MLPDSSTPGGFPIPDRYNLPDLSNLFPKQTLDLMLNMFIGRQPRHAQAAYPQYVNLVRLTDKALEEYLAASACLDDFSQNKNQGAMSPLFRAIDHLENCVNSIHRAFGFAKAIRSTSGRAIPRERLPRDPEVRKVRELRDAIEHLDNDLQNGVEFGTKFLEPAADRMAVGPVSVSWKELAMILGRLHALVLYLNKQGIDAEPPNEG